MCDPILVFGEDVEHLSATLAQADIGNLFVARDIDYRFKHGRNVIHSHFLKRLVILLKVLLWIKIIVSIIINQVGPAAVFI